MGAYKENYWLHMADKIKSIIWGPNACLLMVLLVDNIYQIQRGLQHFVVLKVTERNIQIVFLEHKSPSNHTYSIIVSGEAGRNIG